MSCVSGYSNEHIFTKALSMRFPFEADDIDLTANLDEYIDSVFKCLQSEFMILPKGPGFVEFATFEHGYEVLKRTHPAEAALCACWGSGGWPLRLV